jgi:hypothetical protein
MRSMSATSRDTREPGQPRYSYAQKVLHAFIVDGRLTSIPARERKRQVVLRFLAQTDFEDGREYPEREVDQLLALRNRDVAALRRYLVDGRYLGRHAGTYWRRPIADWPVDQDWPMEAGERGESGDAGDVGADQGRGVANPEE